MKKIRSIKTMSGRDAVVKPGSVFEVLF